MRDFNKSLTCSGCGSHDQYQRVVDLTGQGIRCADCMHIKYVFKPKKNEKQHEKRARMKVAWDKMKKRSTF